MSFLMETHFHTSEVSRCGKVKASDAVRLYKEKGYHGIVVTDHFCTDFFERLGALSWDAKVDAYLEGYHAARAAGKACGIQVILGLEYAFPGTFDDILVYGVTPEMLKANPDMYRLGPVGFAKLAQRENLLLIQAHPFRPYITRVYEDMLEGLEVYNGNPRHDSDNGKAARLAQKKGWVQLSGSDFHQEGDVAAGGILLSEMPSDSPSFAAMLRRIRTPELITGL